MTGANMRFCTASLLLFSSLAVGQEPAALTLKTRIALPNVNGRMDHFAVDVKGQRLFVSALGNHTVEILDVAGGKRLKTLPDLDEPQGLYFDAATTNYSSPLATATQEFMMELVFSFWPRSSFQMMPTTSAMTPAAAVLWSGTAGRRH